jgi:hypothetical protein
MDDETTVIIDGAHRYEFYANRRESVALINHECSEYEWYWSRNGVETFDANDPVTDLRIIAALKEWGVKCDVSKMLEHLQRHPTRSFALNAFNSVPTVAPVRIVLYMTSDKVVTLRLLFCTLQNVDGADVA